MSMDILERIALPAFLATKLGGINRSENSKEYASISLSKKILLNIL